MGPEIEAMLPTAPIALTALYLVLTTECSTGPGRQVVCLDKEKSYTLTELNEINQHFKKDLLKDNVEWLVDTCKKGDLYLMALRHCPSN